MNAQDRAAAGTLNGTNLTQCQHRDGGQNKRAGGGGGGGDFTPSANFFSPILLSDLR